MKIMADDGGVVHRAGPLKQQNKTHKHGRHKSKGTIETKHKGRVDVKSLPGKKIKEARKVDRKNQLKQIRINKRNAILAAKRSLGKEGTPPHLVVIK
jgi:pre-rRNA-processing protein TSR1